MNKTDIVKAWCDFAKDDLITAKYRDGSITHLSKVYRKMLTEGARNGICN